MTVALKAQDTTSGMTASHRRGSLALGSHTPSRFVLLAFGGGALAAGLWTGLVRADVVGTSRLAGVHGILMVFGFLGTLIALERAVAHQLLWGYAGPALSAIAVVVLLTTMHFPSAGLLFAGAAGIVTALYVRAWRVHQQAFVVVMAVGSIAWLVAAALWAGGASPIRLVALLAAFLVLTILGERLELSRLRQPGQHAMRRLHAVVAVFVIGVIASWFNTSVGMIVAGTGLVLMTRWFLRHDIARVTIRKPGLPRFAAACMLAGYAWLAIGGILWIMLGLRIGGPLIYDAATHAVFLGFAISMVMGHAPIILPAVLRIELPHRALAWFPLVLLHTTLFARIIADLSHAPGGRAATAAGNVLALVLFVAISAGNAAHARLARMRQYPCSTAR